MENLEKLNHNELKQFNGGWKLPIGLGGILLIIDAVEGYMAGIEEAYYEKNPPKEN